MAIETWSRSRGWTHARHGLAFWIVWAGVYGYILYMTVSAYFEWRTLQ